MTEPVSNATASGLHSKLFDVNYLAILSCELTFLHYQPDVGNLTGALRLALNHSTRLDAWFLYIAPLTTVDMNNIVLDWSTSAL